ncbi:MAG: polysaccharide deacetylase family protein [Bacteroidetes bacterium]|nr:polysaccharide deacetylase family protein [Bacteroidota bacterium]
MIIKNFLFHRVSDEKDQLWPPMKVRLFRELVRYLSREYHVILLEDFLEGKAELSKRKKAASILFDDGYKDNIENAAPILREFGCPASFYVVTGCIDENIPTWTYITDFLFQHSRKETLELDFNFVPADMKTLNFTDSQERVTAGNKIKPWMKGLNNQDRNEVLEKIKSDFSDVLIPGDKMMNWDDLRQLHDAGFYIGSHSVHHPLLASIKDEGELDFELRESGKRILTETGNFPLTISYPIGSYDEKVKEASRAAGYKYGLAVRQQFFNTKKDDLFSIPRTELYNESMWKCRLRINGFYQQAKKMVSK